MCSRVARGSSCWDTSVLCCETEKPTSNISSLALGPNAEHSSREGEHTVYTSRLEVARGRAHCLHIPTRGRAENVRRCVEVALDRSATVTSKNFISCLFRGQIKMEKILLDMNCLCFRPGHSQQNAQCSCWSPPTKISSSLTHSVSPYPTQCNGNYCPVNFHISQWQPYCQVRKYGTSSGSTKQYGPISALFII
jgi:hypothetical protein